MLRCSEVNEPHWRFKGVGRAKRLPLVAGAGLKDFWMAGAEAALLVLELVCHISPLDLRGAPGKQPMIVAERAFRRIAFTGTIVISQGVYSTYMEGT
jgi:hypothetical protein